MHREQRFQNLISRAHSGSGGASLLMAIVFALTILLTQLSQAQAYRIIYDFADGQAGMDSLAGLATDKAGNLYGTTYVGGSGGGGSVFLLRYTNPDWTLTPLYSFRGGQDGDGPYSGVVVGPDGTLYGTTGYGGSGRCSFGCGTVYSLKPQAHAPRNLLDAWMEAQLHQFTGGTDGAYPYSGDLILDQAGNLYGTMMEAGTFGRGDVYELTPTKDGWRESILYNFSGGVDGGEPVAGLTLDEYGNLFGATTDGGNGHGVIFELTPSQSGWIEHVIYTFQGGSDGSAPYGALTLDDAGNLYGTTCCGGLGGGTVFELSPNNGQWIFLLLYSFGAGEPGAGPVMDGKGNLYGTTARGGAYGQGTIYKLTRSGGSWTYIDLHDFSSDGDGYYPNGLVLHMNGNLYGTTCCGGINDWGVVFEVTP